MSQEREDKIKELAVAIGVDVKEIFCNLKDPNVIPQSGWVLQFDSSENCFKPSMRKVIKSSSLQVNTSTSLQNKINETVLIQRTGRYAVHIAFNWSIDATNSDIEVFALFGNQTLSSAVAGRILKKEGKDASGDFGDGRGTSQTDSFFNTYFIDINNIGNTQVVLQFMPEANGVEAAIFDASIIIEEIFI